MGILVYEFLPGVEIEQLEDEFTQAFAMIRSRLADGDAVVIALEDRHLQGDGTIAEVALAHGMLGLARGLALEGAKAGWRIATLSSTASVPAEERSRWIELLSDSPTALGTLVRLGGEHLGKVPA
jgi:hypothetical protein